MFPFCECKGTTFHETSKGLGKFFKEKSKKEAKNERTGEWRWRYTLFILYIERGARRTEPKVDARTFRSLAKGEKLGAEVNEDDEISPTDDTDLTGLSQI